jgi:asparagine synthase (glutamine-hydrolysing)
VCGIAGIVETERQVEESVIRAMCAQLVHRGPDGEGVHVNGCCGLGMRRLAIIDVTGGMQPIFNEDETAWIVFNGEIYNHLELRAQLERTGHVYRTRSDTETILHAYDQYGIKAVEHLRGMFAFAIWDDRRKQLFAARDRFGEKPFYYALDPHDGSFLFASELKSLIGTGRIPEDIDPVALETYFTFGYIPAPLTIYKHIRKLPPACTLVFAPGQEPVIARYWEMSFDPQPVGIRDWIGEFTDLLKESVRIRLMSEVPLGAFLSGGMDSASVVACMASEVDHPVKTFTISLREESHDESSYAAVVARRFNTEHFTRVVSVDLIGILPKLVQHFGEPFGDSSAVPTYYVSQMAREQVTVALSGDGSDELLAGYNRYTIALEDQGRILPPPLRQIARTASEHWPHAWRGRGRLRLWGSNGRERYLYGLTAFDAGYRRALLGSTHSERDPYTLTYPTLTNPDLLVGLQMTDIALYLPDDINVKVDRMSMACSLEARAPFLDHKLAEFVGRLPRHFFHNGHQGKQILRQAMSDALPPPTLTRAKMGFGMPLAHWMRDPQHSPARVFLDDPGQELYSHVDRRRVMRLLQEHETGPRDWSQQLWTLMVLALWMQMP